MNRRWVVFFQNMLNLDIFSLYSSSKQGEKPNLQLSKLILASHLSKSLLEGQEDLTKLEDGAQDNLSANSDPDPIVETGLQQLESDRKI